MFHVCLSLQIIFYEERNFQGRSYECSSDCSDIHMHLNRCNSCRVDSGCFVVYDRPNFMGNQVFLRRGEYSDFQRMGSMMGMMGMAMMDNIRSCRMVPMVRHFMTCRVWTGEPCLQNRRRRKKGSGLISCLFNNSTGDSSG